MTSTAMNNRFGWVFRIQWSGATMLATAGAAEAVRRSVPALVGHTPFSLMILGVLVPLVTGLFQGAVLHRFGIPVWRWTMATVIGCSVIVLLTAFLISLISQSGLSGVTVVDASGEIRTWSGEEARQSRIDSMIAVASGGASSRSAPADAEVWVGWLGAGVAVGDFDGAIEFAAALMLLGAASLGAAQWAVAKHRGVQARTWTASILIGKIIGLALGALVLSQISDWVSHVSVPFSVTMPTLAASSLGESLVTGSVLARMLQRFELSRKAA